LGVKARAAGIHLVFCAQRPDKDVMPMQLRENLGNRLALKVTSAATSRIVLDQGGAEQLLGRGHLASRLAGDNGFSGSNLGHRPPAPTIGRRSSFLLHQCVPAAAAGALAKKLASLGSTAGANKKGAGLGHELRAEERGLYEERWH
jgi:hypothetical protein